MSVKLSFRVRLVYFGDFVGMTLLGVLFLLRLFDCFLKVCLPTLFPAVLKLYLPPTNSEVSDAADSNKSAPTRVSAGKIYLGKKGIAFLPVICGIAHLLVHVVDQYPYRMESLLVSSNHLVTSFRLKMEFGGFSGHQNKTSGSDRYEKFFSPLVSLKSV